MASTYSTRIRLEKQGSGENANTWGDRLNQNVVSLVDAAIAGVVDVDVDAQTSIALTENNGSLDQGRNAGLNFTGALDAPCTVTYEADSKVYFVNNSTTGDQAVVMKNNTHTVSVMPGETALVASNSTAMYKLGQEFQSGTKMLFYQAAAPLGWTKESVNDKALRVVSGSGGSTAGSIDFSTFFSNYTPEGNIINGTVQSTSLDINKIPTHEHTMIAVAGEVLNFPAVNANNHVAEIGGANYGTDFKYHLAGTNTNPSVGLTGSAGGGNAPSHDHGWSGDFEGTQESFDIAYADVIICTKD